MRKNYNIYQYPQLDLILNIEAIFKQKGVVKSKKEILQKLKLKDIKIKRVNLDFIIDYLQDYCKIIKSKQGYTWIHNENKKFKQLIKESKFTEECNLEIKEV